MQPIVIDDSENGTMWYHPDKKIVHIMFKKYFAGERFRAFLLKGTETMRKYGAKKWLSDDRKNPVLNVADLEWGKTNYFPQTVAAGWKYWAIIQPEAALAMFTLEDMVKEYAKAGITAKFFTDPDEAMKWLESQP